MIYFRCLLRVISRVTLPSKVSDEEQPDLRALGPKALAVLVDQEVVQEQYNT